MILSIVALTGLLVASAFFSATETAFTSLSDYEIHEMARTAGRRGLWVERALRNSAALLTTILIGNNLANIGAAAIVTLITQELFGTQAVSAASGILTLVVLIFCEVSPKRIAIIHSGSLALATVYPITILGIIIKPFVLLVTWISSFITRLFGVSKNTSPSIDGILSLVNTAEHAGVVKRYEGRMVKRIFRLDDIPVQAVMTHRTDVFSLDRQTKIREAVGDVIAHGYSRIPVFEDDPEKIVGVVLAKDMLRAYASRREGDSVGMLMKEPIFVSDAWKINEAFTRFQKHRLKLAIVLDEYGGFSGIITLEDIAEEVFGEIYDETDSTAPLKIETLADGRFRLAADLTLPSIHDAIGIEFEEGRQDQTLGSYLLERLERIPESGEKIVLGHVAFEIERIEDMRILSVLCECGKADQ